MKIRLFTLLLLLVVATPLALQAQTKIYFKYDGSGNRRLRTIDMSKSATIAAQGQDEELLDSRLGDQEIRIYPNPTKGLLRIDMPELSTTTVSLQVFDSRGSLLISKTAAETGNQLDLSAYPGGMYILLIRTAKDKQEWKIIKE